MKILWAIDPFEPDNTTRSRVVETLKYLETALGAQIEPVYVLSPTEGDSSQHLTWTEEARQGAEKMLLQSLKSCSLKHPLPPQVLLESQPSLDRSVRRLLEYANLSGSDLVVVGTQARTGIARLFLGSFAETLSLYAQVPLWVIGPHAAFNSGLSPLVYASDLKNPEDPHWDQVLDLAQTLKASMVLFHAISKPTKPMIQSGFYLFSGSWVDWPTWISHTEQKKRLLADHYIQKAQKRHIPVDMHLEVGTESVSTMILKYAQEKPVGLLALAAQKGPWSAAFMGSVTRQVLREAPVPVWVMRQTGSSEAPTDSKGLKHPEHFV